MGKNNRARRAAKAKAKAKAKRPVGGHNPPQDNPFGDLFSNSQTGPRRGASDPVGPETRWLRLEQAAHAGDPDLQKLAERMVRDDPYRGLTVAQTILLSYVAGLWKAGWQPRELVRQAKLKGSATSAQVIEVAILADHGRRAGQALGRADR